MKNIVANILSQYKTTNNPKIAQAINKVQMSETFASTDDFPMDVFPSSFKIIARYQLKDTA